MGSAETVLKFEGEDVGITYSSEEKAKEFEEGKKKIREAKDLITKAMTIATNPADGVKVVLNSLIESGFELAAEIREIQEKLNVISDKVDLTVIADVKSDIAYGWDQLKKYKEEGKESCLENFIKEATKGLTKFKTYLEKQNPNPGLMNCFAIIVSWVEACVGDIEENGKLKDLESVHGHIESSKKVLLGHLNTCIEYLDSKCKFYNHGKKFVDSWHNIEISSSSRNDNPPWGDKLHTTEVYVDRRYRPQFTSEICGPTYECVKGYINTYPFDTEEKEKFEKLDAI